MRQLHWHLRKPQDPVEHRNLGKARLRLHLYLQNTSRHTRSRVRLETRLNKAVCIYQTIVNARWTADGAGRIGPTQGTDHAISDVHPLGSPIGSGGAFLGRQCSTSSGAIAANSRPTGAIA